MARKTKAAASKWAAYAAYKDSGVEWLGEIPVGWETRRLKLITRFEYGDSLLAENRASGDTLVYGSNGVVGAHNESNTKSPCIVIGRKGSFGKVVFSAESCFVIDTAFFVDCTQTQNVIKWLYYALHLLKLDALSKDSAVPGLSREDAYRNILPYCSLSEQRAIAAFLDRETARVDALIEKKRQQIALLREKRVALISACVTGKVEITTAEAQNAAAPLRLTQSPSRPMKDSGVEWLGEIPVGWETKRLKWSLQTLESGARETGGGNLYDDGIFSIGGEHIGWVGELYTEPQRFISEEFYATMNSGKLAVNDVLLVKDGATIGKVALITAIPFNKAAVNEHVFILRTNNHTDPTFLFYFLQSTYGQQQIQSHIKGSAQPGLNAQFVDLVDWCIPSKLEQQLIATFLNRATTRIDTLIEKVDNSIKLLREYRTALISAAVTGKIKLEGD